jgi:hypothetical protein
MLQQTLKEALSIYVKIVDDILFMIKVKTWAELLNTFCTSGKLELELMYKVQMQC